MEGGGFDLLFIFLNNHAREGLQCLASGGKLEYRPEATVGCERYNAQFSRKEGNRARFFEWRRASRCLTGKIAKAGGSGALRRGRDPLCGVLELRESYERRYRAAGGEHLEMNEVGKSA